MGFPAGLDSAERRLGRVAICAGPGVRYRHHDLQDDGEEPGAQAGAAGALDADHRHRSGGSRSDGKLERVAARYHFKWMAAIGAPPLTVISHGLDDGYLSEDQVQAVVASGLTQLALDGLRVLVLIPDGTRTMPMPLLFGILEHELGPRVRSLDFLVALGTHSPMSDAQLSGLIGRSVTDGSCGKHRVFNHHWDSPSAFAKLGEISADEIESLTGGLLRQAVPVNLNRLILDYDHILICGPVFPHEVAGFSGGAKYFFPGIAAPEIIHFTHWLGALISNYEIIGTADTVVRAVIHRAAACIDRPHSLLAPVVTHDGVAGVFCGPTIDTWKQAAELSSRCHVVIVEKPFTRVLAVMPTMYS